MKCIKIVKHVFIKRIKTVLVSIIFTSSPRLSLFFRWAACVSLMMFVALHVCVLVAVCSLSVSASQSSSYGERGSDLGLQVFLRMVQNKPKENVVMSPHGVASVLGVLLPGAHGDTQRQLLKGLKYKKTGVCLHWFHLLSLALQFSVEFKCEWYLKPDSMLRIIGGKWQNLESQKIGISTL